MRPPRFPKGLYVGSRRSGNLLFVSGQTTDHWKGPIHEDSDLPSAVAAAEDAAMNVLSLVHGRLGTLDRISRLIRVVGFVACRNTFTKLPAVLDGASDLLVGVLAEAGRHARSDVGVAALPGGALVEIETVFAVDA